MNLRFDIVYELAAHVRGGHDAAGLLHRCGLRKLPLKSYIQVAYVQMRLAATGVLKTFCEERKLLSN